MPRSFSSGYRHLYMCTTYPYYVYCNLLSHSEKPTFVICADQKHNEQDDWGWQSWIIKVEDKLLRLFLTAELSMKIQNGCIPLESATALHDYTWILGLLGYSDTHNRYRIDLLTWVGNKHIIVVDRETIHGYLPCVISSIILLTFLETNGHITGNGDFRSGDNELEYVILCHPLKTKWNIYV